MNVAIITASGSYKMEDFAPLAAEPELNLYTVTKAEEWGEPELILLPGTPTVADDFDVLSERGIIPLIREHAAAGKWIFGICGGMHMLGKRLLDPTMRKHPYSQKELIGLLDLETHYGDEPILARLKNVSAPWQCTLRGFETHTGRARGDEPVLFRRADGSPIGFGHGRILATYLHRCFDNADFRQALLRSVRENALI